MPHSVDTASQSSQKAEENRAFCYKIIYFKIVMTINENENPRNYFLGKKFATAGSNQIQGAPTSHLPIYSFHKTES